MNNNDLQSQAEEHFSSGKTLEMRVTDIERDLIAQSKEIIIINGNCENHKAYSQKVFDELMKLKSDFKSMKDSMKEITIVKNVVESINLILAKRNSILPNGAKTGIRDVNWISIAKGIGLIIAMAASAYFGGTNVPQ